jgi:hypothetical protein
VDYDETFSPIAMLKSIRVLLAIAAHFDYEIWHMDVKTAFLNGNLAEELYMVQPEGFVDPEDDGKVCKLQHSIYGLKQPSRSWNLRFDEVIKGFGFVQNFDEYYIYKKVSGSSVAFLVLYVDDILLMGNDLNLLNSINEYLNSKFSMKYLGESAYILGIKIYRDRSRCLIALNLATYIDKMLKKYSIDGSKKGTFPIVKGRKLSKAQCPVTVEDIEKMKDISYALVVGSIMYAMLGTRPGVALDISMSGRFQSNHGK